MNNNNSQPRVTLDRDLAAIQDDLLRMGGLVDAAIERAMKSLISRSSASCCHSWWKSRTPPPARSGSAVLFSAHNLERSAKPPPVGDRAINIAERVIFMTSGEMKELNAGPDAPLAD